MNSPRALTSAADFQELEGETIGVSSWLTVDQDMIDAFARTTRDEQWIHVDPERATSGPFGSTIAHGFLVLSLIPGLTAEVYDASTFTARVNYGLERVRFPKPLRAGEQLRDRIAIEQVDLTDRGIRVTFTHTLESNAGERPVCVAQVVILFVY